MCLDPATLMALQIAAAGAGLMAQQQQMQATQDANARMADAARNKTINDIALNTVQRNEAFQAASQKANDASIATMKAQATAATSAGEAGIGMGGSVQAVMADLGAQGSKDIVNAMTNYVRESNSLDAQYQNIFITEGNTLAQMPQARQPDYLGAAVAIGSADANYTKATGKSFFSG